LRKDDACLRGVVRDESGVLNELREVQVGGGKVSDFRDELKG
jgi:hypothetical protein